MGESTPYIPALGYRWLTPAYDTVLRLTTRERTFKRALLAQAGLRPGQKVLDLACGSGTLAVWAQQAAPAAQVQGVDADPDMLERARAKAAAAGLSIPFSEGLAEALPHADASFDRVLSSLFFHHLDRAGKQRALAEALRVLKPGGELHVADWGQAANPPMRVAFYAIQLLDGFPNTADNVAGRLPEMMKGAEFEPVEETARFSTMWGTLSLYRASRPR